VHIDLGFFPTLRNLCLRDGYIANCRRLRVSKRKTNPAFGTTSSCERAYPLRMGLAPLLRSGSITSIRRCRSIMLSVGHSCLKCDEYRPGALLREVHSQHLQPRWLPSSAGFAVGVYRFARPATAAESPSPPRSVIDAGYLALSMLRRRCEPPLFSLPKPPRQLILLMVLPTRNTREAVGGD
jgi:hypothetical protein